MSPLWHSDFLTNPLYLLFAQYVGVVLLSQCLARLCWAFESFMSCWTLLAGLDVLQKNYFIVENLFDHVSCELCLKHPFRLFILVPAPLPIVIWLSLRINLLLKFIRCRLMLQIPYLNFFVWVLKGKVSLLLLFLFLTRRWPQQVICAWNGNCIVLVWWRTTMPEDKSLTRMIPTKFLIQSQLQSFLTDRRWSKWKYGC